MKTVVDKLYSFVAKLLIMLEEEIDELQCNSDKKTSANKKQIADFLNKLVNLLVQLNKIRGSEELKTNKEISVEDKAIIEKFLQKYNDVDKKTIEVKND